MLNGDAVALRVAAVAEGHVDAFLSVALQLHPAPSVPHALPGHTPTLQLGHDVDEHAYTSVWIHSPVLFVKAHIAMRERSERHVRGHGVWMQLDEGGIDGEGETCERVGV